MMQPRGSRARCLAEDFARDCLPYAAGTARRPPGTVYLQRVVHRTESMLNKISVLPAICFAAGALAAEAWTGSQSSTCGAAKCETVGGTQICTECATDGNVPINSTCKSKDDPTVDTAGCKKNGGGSLTADKVCGQCDGVYFLYKDECYSTGDATGQKLCTKAVDGVCTTTASGCFILPGATKTDQAIMACDDTAEITLTNTKKYAGVANCGTCGAPAAASETTAEATTCTA